MLKNRNVSYDCISGIMILWMVVYHAFMWGGLSDTDTFHVLLRVLFFFMPWFYFKSGVVFKTRPFREAFTNDLNRLIFPMLIWTLIGFMFMAPKLIYIDRLPIGQVLSLPVDSLLISGDTKGNAPLWFLLSLFIVKCLMAGIVRLNRRIQFILLPLLAGVGWLLYREQLLLPLGFSTIPLGLLFALSGYLFGEQISRVSFLSQIMVICVTVGLAYAVEGYVDIHVNTLWYGSYIGYIVTSLLSVCSVLFLFRKIAISPLIWIGRKSMYLLLIHWPVFTLITLISYRTGLPVQGNSYAVTLGTIALLVSLLAARFIPESWLGIHGTKSRKYLYRRAS
ncbi:acyltransferase family protein [Vibrio mangrovi]|nr:acyltransferase family protein [Vibrio mangrovi]MDW6003286.1 acyltransferase family protein [Vibrio mangrovi]